MNVTYSFGVVPVYMFSELFGIGLPTGVFVHRNYSFPHHLSFHQLPAILCVQLSLLSLTCQLVLPFFSLCLAVMSCFGFFVAVVLFFLAFHSCFIVAYLHRFLYTDSNSDRKGHTYV